MAFYYEVLAKSAAAWTADVTTVLKPNQEGVESDTGKRKLGDGTSLWGALSYGTASGGNVTGQASSVDGEVALFSSTMGKVIKRSTLTGVPKQASGVQSGTPATINDLGSQTADYDANTHKITGVVDPSAAQHAATKNYVDTRHVTDLTAPATDFSMNAHKITSMADGTAAQDSATMTNLWALVSAEPPSLHGLKGWSYPLSAAAANTIIPTGGTVYFAQVYTPSAIAVTTLWLAVTTGGGTLTAAGLALYSSAGALLQSNVVTSGANLTQFQGTGGKSLTVSSQAFNAGDKFYVAFFFTGTTMPTLARGGNAAAAYDLNLVAPNLRFGSADTGRTTTFPSSMGSQAVGAVSYWAGVS
jgi:hypothetical protein